MCTYLQFFCPLFFPLSLSLLFCHRDGSHSRNVLILNRDCFFFFILLYQAFHLLLIDRLLQNTQTRYIKISKLSAVLRINQNMMEELT